jgi:hypothetical protein
MEIKDLAVDEFAKVADVKDCFHSEYLHAACSLIAHEVAKRKILEIALTKNGVA